MRGYRNTLILIVITVLLIVLAVTWGNCRWHEPWKWGRPNYDAVRCDP